MQNEHILNTFLKFLHFINQSLSDAEKQAIQESIETIADVIVFDADYAERDVETDTEESIRHELLTLNECNF